MTSPLLKAIPNTLSGIRIVLGAAFPWTPPTWRLPAVAAAVLTDLLDGETSRLFKVETTTGQILDPVADKIFLLGVVATLLAEDMLLWWQLALIGLRDIAVVVACAVLVWRMGWTALKNMRARWPGKLTTAFQLLFLLAVLAEEPVFVTGALLFLAAFAGIVATVDYIVAFRG